MNDALKAEIRKNRLYNYEVAAQIGISEYTFCKWFRQELTAEQIERIRKAIKELRGQADGL